MDQAVTGLVGAVIGGVLTAGSNIGLEWTRNRRLESASQRRHEQEFREAARLIDEELIAAIETLQAAEMQHTWPLQTQQLPTQTWQHYAPVIARSDISEDAWSWLADTYLTIREANARILAADHQQLDTNAANYLKGVRSAVDEGLSRLRKALPVRTLTRVTASHSDGGP